MKTTFWVILLLIGSNLFMTVAWYGHLKYKHVAIGLAILVSWLIALPEYALQVPANRLGYGQFSATQLKIIQEVVSLSVFAGFAFLCRGERPTWPTATAFLFIIAAAALIRGDNGNAKPDGANAAAVSSPSERPVKP